MDVGVGSTSVDHRCVNKEYQERFRLSEVNLKQATTMTEPIFVFDLRRGVGDGEFIDVADLADINYLHWFKAKRFYYCKVVFNGNLVEFHCTLDPRRTWKDTIRNSTQYVERQENKFNKRLFDSEIALENGKVVNMYQFPTPVGDSTATSRNYVLITNGKKEGDNNES